MLPKVTIQIPTYNQRQYIKEALNSALKQTYDNLEIIVSDDCSTDYDIFEYLKEYKDNPKIIIHRNEKNLGRVGNYRFTLYNLVKGEWFINLDGDDYFTDPNFVSYGIESILGIASDVVVFKGNTATVLITKYNIRHRKLNLNTFYLSGLDYIAHLEKEFGFTHASLIFNVAMAKKAAFYNIDVLDSDYFSFLKILRNGNILVCNRLVYECNRHELQESRKITFDSVIDKFLALKDLESYYHAITVKNKSDMLRTTSFNLYIQLLNSYFSDRISLINTVKLMKKTKLERKYIFTLFAKVKQVFLYDKN